MKSVLVDFLVGAGIKPTSIVSYNHLGNNDGMNLSAPQVRARAAWQCRCRAPPRCWRVRGRRGRGQRVSERGRLSRRLPAQHPREHSLTPCPHPPVHNPAQTFRSKEISKSNVVDDMVSSNAILYG